MQANPDVHLVGSVKGCEAAGCKTGGADKLGHAKSLFSIDLAIVECAVNGVVHLALSRPTDSK